MPTIPAVQQKEVTALTNEITQLNKNLDCENIDTVFLALPHGVSNNYVKLYTF